MRQLPLPGVSTMGVVAQHRYEEVLGGLLRVWASDESGGARRAGSMVTRRPECTRRAIANRPTTMPSSPRPPPVRHADRPRDPSPRSYARPDRLQLVRDVGDVRGRATHHARYAERLGELGRLAGALVAEGPVARPDADVPMSMAASWQRPALRHA